MMVTQQLTKVALLNQKRNCHETLGRKVIHVLSVTLVLFVPEKGSFIKEASYKYKKGKGI